MQFSRRLCIAGACSLGLLLAASAATAQNTKLLPNDTELVVTINLAQLLKSEVVKSNQLIIDVAKNKIDDTLQEKGIAKYLKKANFDVFRDLNSITLAMPGGDRDPEDGFILLEGKFNADKIEAAITAAAKDKEASGVKLMTIGGVTAFEFSPKDEKSMFVGVLDKNTMIACASKTDFAEAVTRLKGTKAAKFKAPVIKSLLQTVNSKQSISIVATSEILLKVANKNAPDGAGDKLKQAAAMAKNLDGISAAVTVQKDIDFQLGINTKDEDTASQIAAMSTLAIGALKAKAEDAAKGNDKLKSAVDVLKTVRARAKGPNLVISGQITSDTLTEMLKNLPLPKSDN